MITRCVTAVTLLPFVSVSWIRECICVSSLSSCLLLNKSYMKNKMFSRNATKLTFSPETGSTTGSSTAACLMYTLPLVARNIILSNGMDFSLGTRPVINPNFTCFDDSFNISYRIASQLL